MKTLVTLISIWMISAMISPQAALCQEVGKITYTEGRVDLLRKDMQNTFPIRADETISIEDSIRTKAGSKAEILFKDGSTVRLAQNTKVVIKGYDLDEKLRRKSAEILIERGKARSIIAKVPEAADFIISTPNAKGKVKGSDIFAFYSAGNSGMFVSEGRLAVINTAHPEKELTVTAGNSVIIPSEEAPVGPRPVFEIEKKLHERDTNIPLIQRQPEEAVSRGMVVMFSGDVNITKKDSGSTHKASIGEIVQEGDKIVTGNNGYVEIRFDNGNSLNLKPDTELIIVKLAMDLKTGEYDNSFQSGMGKIKARIENLKGGSTFKISTPTAVSGARGTFMYMNILSNLTTSFFEGGSGYLMSTISGITRILESGESSAASDTGSISEAVYTTGSDRDAFSEGWDTGGGAEGYSEPEGDADTGMGGPDTGYDNSGAGGDDAGGGENGNQSLLYIPPKENLPPAPGPNNMLLDSSGYMYNTVEQGGEEVGVQTEGLIGFSGGIWGNKKVSDFTSIGSLLYSESESFDNKKPFIWHSNKVGLFSYDISKGTSTTYDGGAIFGMAGGLGNDNVLEGLVLALYIDPNRNAGILMGRVDGRYSIDLNLYMIEGPILNSVKAQNVDMSPEELVNNVHMSDLAGKGFGNFEDHGLIEAANISGRTLEISNAPWGIWGIRIYGEYSNAASPWTLGMGGTSTGTDKKKSEYDGVWLGTAKGSDWKGGRLVDSSFKGYYFSPVYDKEKDEKKVKEKDKDKKKIEAGRITGDVRGGYVEVEENSGTWQAVSGGEWVEVTDLLDVAQLGFDMRDLNDFVSVPITEVYSSISSVAGSFNGGIGQIAGTMDMSFYANSNPANNGIWAALVSGLYSGMPAEVTNWTANVAGTTSAGPISAVITGTKWAGNQWAGTINSSEGSAVNFRGQAAGTYTAADETSGSLTGIGAGEWQRPS